VDIVFYGEEESI